MTVKSRFTLCLLAALLQGCESLSDYFSDAGPAPAAVERRLADWLYCEYWTGVVFNGNKIVFTHLQLRPAADAPGRFEIESEAVLRLRFLGFEKRVNLRAWDRVRADLTLERFRYRYDLDGSELKVEGELTAAAQTSDWPASIVCALSDATICTPDGCHQARLDTLDLPSLIRSTSRKA